MTTADLDRLEQELGFSLPAAYREIMADLPAELREWPRVDGVPHPRHNSFGLDPDRLLQATARVRKRLRKEFPPQGFVIGGDPGGWWLVDAAEAEPRVRLVTRDFLLDGFESLREFFETIKADHAETCAKAAKAAAAGPKPKLTPEELLAEGRRLARPAVAYRDRGTRYAAVWKGSGVVPAGDGEWRHWISLDAAVLPQNPRGLTGVVSLYESVADDDTWGSLKVAHDPAATLPTKPDGKRLFAEPFDCMPDVDAIFQFGSDDVKAWAERCWDPNKGYTRTPVKEYLKVLQREHPFQAGRAYAMSGGWSWCFTWCYSIDEEYPWHLFDQALIVLTLEDSEPWIEVFDDGAVFTTFSRIT
jgi:hypothetical protein